VSALTTQQLRGEIVNITYSLSTGADVVVEVRNISGRLVGRIACGPTTSGVRTTSWNARNLSGAQVPSGMYLCTVLARSDDGSESRAVTTVQLQQ
jgi:flagellar hook assembly protein FlgD